MEELREATPSGLQSDVRLEDFERHKGALRSALVLVMRAPCLIGKEESCFPTRGQVIKALFRVSPPYDQVPVDIRGGPKGIGIVSESATIQPEAVNQARLAFMPVYAKVISSANETAPSAVLGKCYRVPGRGWSLFQISRAIFQAPSDWRWYTVMYLPLSSMGPPPALGINVIV